MYIYETTRPRAGGALSDDGFALIAAMINRAKKAQGE
jgi:hypothetical protein